MIGVIARGAYILIVGLMIAAWALAPGKSEPAGQSNQEPLWVVFA